MKSFLLLLFLSNLVTAQIIMRPGGPIPPMPPIPIDMAQSTLCKLQCANGIQYLTFMTISSASGTRACPEKVTTSRSCAPFICDNGIQCKTTCATNSDCAGGYACVSGVCSSISYYCSDAYTSAGTDGSKYDCGAYLCQSGQCIKRCASTNDCTPGFTCDIEPGVCVSTR